jgi:electron transport complex protein RnfE
MAADSGTASDDLLRGLWRENPVFVQLLGMCPTLAVTNSAINALAMGLATAFVLVLSNLLVSSLRSFIPRQVRIATYILIIATFVTVVDYLIQAVSLELHKALGAFISLIVVNCVILGRAEAFASRHGVGRALLDGLGMGLGFTGALLAMGVVRELLGNGSIFAVPVLPQSFQPWVIMLLPGGGFFTLGLLLLLINAGRRRAQRRVQQATGQPVLAEAS